MSAPHLGGEGHLAVARRTAQAAAFRGGRLGKLLRTYADGRGRAGALAAVVDALGAGRRGEHDGGEDRADRDEHRDRHAGAACFAERSHSVRIVVGMRSGSGRLPALGSGGPLAR